MKKENDNVTQAQAIEAQAANAELIAVSSHKMETAETFAASHGLDQAFDSWADMVAWDGVDAIYVATPTSRPALNTARAGQIQNRSRYPRRTQEWLDAVWNSALASELS